MKTYSLNTNNTFLYLHWKCVKLPDSDIWLFETGTKSANKLS